MGSPLKLDEDSKEGVDSSEDGISEEDEAVSDELIAALDEALSLEEALFPPQEVRAKDARHKAIRFFFILVCSLCIFCLLIIALGNRKKHCICSLLKAMKSRLTVGGFLGSAWLGGNKGD